MVDTVSTTTLSKEKNIHVNGFSWVLLSILLESTKYES